MPIKDEAKLLYKGWSQTSYKYIDKTVKMIYTIIETHQKYRKV